MGSKDWYMNTSGGPLMYTKQSARNPESFQEKVFIFMLSTLCVHPISPLTFISPTCISNQLHILLQFLNIGKYLSRTSKDGDQNRKGTWGRWGGQHEKKNCTQKSQKVS